MQSFRKAARSVGANKVHPTESQDADSEMVQPPRRRRQSFSREVLENSPKSPVVGSIKESPENAATRRPSIDGRLTPTARTSTVPTSFRRRSLSNGSVGSDIAGLREQGDIPDAAKRASVSEDSSSHQKRAQPKAVAANADEENGTNVAVPRKDMQQVQSLALQRFFSSAQNANSWSASSKKMIFASEIDDAKLVNRSKLEARCPHRCCCLHTSCGHCNSCFQQEFVLLQTSYILRVLFCSSCLPHKQVCTPV